MPTGGGAAGPAYNHSAAYLNDRAFTQAALTPSSRDKYWRRLNLFFSTLKDAETGARGYLLTGRDSYLDLSASAWLWRKSFWKLTSSGRPAIRRRLRMCAALEPDSA